MSLQRWLTVAVMGVVLSLAAAAMAQERPTLDIEPKNGTPGTIIELSGEGYSEEFGEITVEWGFENEPVQPIRRLWAPW